MATYFFLVGIPGSGKSTYAKYLAGKGVWIVNTDRIRYEYRVGSEEAFTIARKVINSTLRNGTDVVFDATNTQRTYRRENILAGKTAATKTICLWMDTPLDLCIARHQERQILGMRTTLSLERLRQFAFQFASNPPMLDEGFDEIRRIEPHMVPSPLQGRFSGRRT